MLIFTYESLYMFLLLILLDAMGTSKVLEEIHRAVRHPGIIAYGTLALGMLPPISFICLFLAIAPELSTISTVYSQSQLRRPGNFSSHVPAPGNNIARYSNIVYTSKVIR